MAEIFTPSRTPRLPRSSWLRGAATAAAALLIGGLALAGATSASAATTDGWARIAHLSPDTRSVDVRLTALAGGGALYDLKGISYGQITDYLAMPAGTYVVSMVPAGTDPTATPMISQSVTVAQGEPITVAAYGTNMHLQTAVYKDDLTSPGDGQSRVRVIQASTVAHSVDISTSSGLSIAQAAQQGAATGYATVPARPWTLQLSGDATGSADVTLSSGTVNTLLVLDTADHGLTVKLVVDAAAPATVPAQGVNTGGGWAATNDRSPTAAVQIGLGLGAILAIGLAAFAAFGRDATRTARTGRDIHPRGTGAR